MTSLKRRAFSILVNHVAYQIAVSALIFLGILLPACGQADRVNLLISDIKRQAPSDVILDLAVEVSKSGESAVNPLIPMLGDPIPGVRSNTLIALRTIISQEFGKRRKPATERLLATLVDPDPNIRTGAALALESGGIRDQRVTELISVAISVPDPKDRLSAIETLSLIKDDPRLVKPLVAALDDPDRDVRLAALEILEQQKDPNALDALIAALGNSHRDVRSWAYSAAAKNPRAANFFIAHDATIVAQLSTAMNDPNLKVRESAATELSDILTHVKDPRAIEPMIAALSDDDVIVRREAADAFAELGAITVGEIAVDLGARIGPYEIGPLAVALKDSDDAVRQSSVEALGTIRDPRADAALLAALKDPANMEYAWEQVVRHGVPGSEDALIAALYHLNTVKMGQALLNCGNPKLEQATIEWASRHNVQIESNRYANVPLQWGSWR